MRAAVYHAPGAPLTIEDVPDPTPGPAELLLGVKACGICGTDLHWSDRKADDGGWRALDAGTVMGHEFAGEIVEVGRDLKGEYRIGERVVVQPFIGCGQCSHCLTGRAYRCPSVKMRATQTLTGAYADYTRIGVHETLRLPDNMAFREGALVEPLAVGLNAVRKAALQPGDAVLIVGAGPVGLAVALWCRFFGASHVVVSDLVRERAEQVARFGGTAVIAASQEDVRSAAERICGAPPAVIFDCVGVPGTLQLVVDYAHFDARIVVVGLCMSADRFAPATAITKELQISFAFVYQKQDFATVIDLIGRERIDPSGMISQCVGFDSFPSAFESLKTPSESLKSLLEPDA